MAKSKMDSVTLSKIIVEAAVSTVEDKVDNIMGMIDSAVTMVDDVTPKNRDNAYGHLTACFLERVMGHIAGTAGHTNISKQMFMAEVNKILSDLHKCASSSFVLNRKEHTAKCKTKKDKG